MKILKIIGPSPDPCEIPLVSVSQEPFSLDNVTF